MDENTKLYVFSKREVALIFLFMFLIALTSFVFGVKIGKNYSYGQSGLTPAERNQVELLSGQEEKVNEVVKEVENSEAADKVIVDDLNKKLEQHIKTETEGGGKRFDKEKVEEVESEEDTSVEADQSNQKVEPAPGSTVDSGISTQPAQDQYTGKYTVVLGSFQSMEEAQGFAEGFKVRGYNPIINEVELANKGIWYRVSLGVFENITAAKEYVKKEYSLFQGQEHYFNRFD